MLKDSRFKERWQKLRRNLNLVRTLKLIWSETKGRVAFTFMVVIIESAIFFASLYMFKMLIDEIAKTIQDQGNASVVLQYLLAAGLLSILYVILKTVSAYLTEKQALVISEYIDDKIHAAAIELDLSFYESPAYFDTLKRAKDAGPERPNAILTNIVDISKNFMMLLVIGAALISISWMLIILLAMFVLPTLLVKINFADKLFEWQRNKTSLERKSSYFSSLIIGDSAAKEIKAFELGEYLRTLYLNIRMDLLNERLKITKRGSFNEVVTTIIATTGLFTCMAYICIGTLNGTTTVGDLTLFLVIFPQMFNIMQGLSNGISELYQNNIFLSYLFELFDLKKTMQDPVEPLHVPLKNSDLIVENVDFVYPHSNEPVLKNISLRISPGKLIAVVGLNGAGKTTLIKLLCRLYDPTSGFVKLNGTDIRNFKIKDFRREVSVVFQDFVKYNFSAADNIRFGDIHTSSCENRMMNAATKSGAHHYIKNFPGGYDTMMGRVFEDGREISVGQWQKLAVARAFYSNSRFIIFDEASSALDARAENELFESLRKNLDNKGILLISHRLSAVKHADYIYVMSEGKICQQGTHEELINSPGDYSELFTRNSFQEVNYESGFEA